MFSSLTTASWMKFAMEIRGSYRFGSAVKVGLP
jgi:hypothetical protein